MLSLIAKFLCNIACFLYPAYASYKALSITPGHSPEADFQVERWLMYWAVVGSWTAVEAVIGWTFTWLPFYSVGKTLFFLYLSLPQSQGSNYIYRTQLAPFFHSHEGDIDAFLASLKSRATTALSGGMGWLWEIIRQQLSTVMPPAEAYRQNDQVQQNAPQPPTLADPASGAAQQVYGFLSRYAGHYMPMALTAIQAAAANATSANPPRTGINNSGMTGQIPGSRSLSFSGPSGPGGPGIPRDPSHSPESTVQMPIPIPTPSPSTSDTNLRSRAYHMAQNSPGSAGSAPPGYYQQQQQQQQQHPSNLIPNNPYAHLGVSSARYGPQGIGYPQGPRSVSSPSPNVGHIGLSQRSSEESIHSQRSGSSSATQGHGTPHWSGEMSYETIRREDVVDAPAVPVVPPRPSSGGRRSSWFGWGGVVQAHESGADESKPKIQ